MKRIYTFAAAIIAAATLQAQNARIVLDVPQVIWPQNPGWQILIDNTATQTDGFLDIGMFQCGTPYDNWSHTIPADADASNNHVIGAGQSGEITIPAGVYDYLVVNPNCENPYGDPVVGIGPDQCSPSRGNNFEFQAGRVYTFTLSKEFNPIYMAETACVTLTVEEVAMPSVLTLAPAVNGTLASDPAAGDIMPGTQVTLTATPDPGFRLASLKAVRSDNPAVELYLINNGFSMPQFDVVATAIFEPALQVTCAPAQNGTVSASPSADLSAGDIVTLTASPDPGFQLASLAAYKTGDPAVAVDIAADNTFAMPDFSVTVEALFASATGVAMAQAAALRVYPNPAGERLTVEGAGVASVEVLTLAGQVVARAHGPVADLGGLAAGAYLARVRMSDGSVATRQFFKK